MEITPELRQAVAEDTCRRSGHDLETIRTMASDVPVLLLCNCCGRSWHVAADKAGDPLPVDDDGWRSTGRVEHVADEEGLVKIRLDNFAALPGDHVAVIRLRR